MINEITEIGFYLSAILGALIALTFTITVIYFTKPKKDKK